MPFIQTEMVTFKNQFLNDLRNSFVIEDRRGDVSRMLSDKEIDKLRSTTIVLEKAGGGASITGMKTIPEPGWFWRSKKNRADNNLMRQQFLAAVLEECDVHPSDPNVKLSDLNMGQLKSLAKQNLPPEVLSVLKLDDYGSRGRPLTVFRMQSVLTSISTVRSVDPLLNYYKELWTDDLNGACKELDPAQKATVLKLFDDLAKQYVKTFESCFAPLNVALDVCDEETELAAYLNAIQDYRENFVVRFDDDLKRLVGPGKPGRNTAEVGVDMINDLSYKFFLTDLNQTYKEKIFRKIEDRLEVNIKDLSKEDLEKQIQKFVRLDAGCFTRDLGVAVQHLVHYAAVSFFKKHPHMLKYLKFGYGFTNEKFTDPDMKSFYLTNPVMQKMDKIFASDHQESIMLGKRRIDTIANTAVGQIFSEIARQLYKAEVIDGNLTWQQPQ